MVVPPKLLFQELASLETHQNAGQEALDLENCGTLTSVSSAPFFDTFSHLGKPLS